MQLTPKHAALLLTMRGVNAGNEYRWKTPGGVPIHIKRSCVTGGDAMNICALFVDNEHRHTGGSFEVAEKFCNLAWKE